MSSVVVRVVVRDAVWRDLVEEVRLPVEERIVQAGSVASLPERCWSGNRKHHLELGELTPHVRRNLTITLQVVGLDAVEDAFETLNVLDAQLPTGLCVFGAGLCRVHVGDCALEAHVVRRLTCCSRLLRLSSLS